MYTYTYLRGIHRQHEQRIQTRRSRWEAHIKQVYRPLSCHTMDSGYKSIEIEDLIGLRPVRMHAGTYTWPWSKCCGAGCCGGGPAPNPMRTQRWFFIAHTCKHMKMRAGPGAARGGLSVPERRGTYVYRPRCRFLAMGARLDLHSGGGGL